MRIVIVAWLAVFSLAIQAAETAFDLETFEAPTDRWSFSPGGEFPGAKGGFSVTNAAAHAGRLGGRLSFDFSGGGNYVAAIFRAPGAAPANLNALQLWIKRPSGNGLVFRYSDPTGQTFQKAVECTADRWARLTIPFTNWTAHWGGANDGQVRGQPKTLALLVDNGEHATGVVDFDDLQLVNADAQIARVSYPANKFDPSEGWRMRADGNAGQSALAGKIWTLDFSQGARSLALTLPDRTLPGSVEKIRIRAKGNAKGHPVTLTLRTHFMGFRKVIGEFAGESDLEVVTDGPPGPGWEWFGGENDGKIHGPLRLGEIQIAGNNQRDRAALEMVEVRIDGSCPPEKRCLLVAETRDADGQPQFIVRARGMSPQPLTGTLDWILRNWDGRELGKSSRPVTLPALAAQAEFSVPVPQAPGAKFIEAEFTLNIEGQEIPPVQAVWLATLEQKGDAALQPESPFGMGVYLCRYGGDARGLVTMERAAQMARDAGVKWSREDFSWSRIEPRKGQFDWTYYDNLVACAKRNGITVYPIACYWSSWTKPYTKEGLDDYIRYLQAMVRHYKNDLKQWEIWNEPNIFFWQGPKEMYAELLIRSYAAIKEIDPQAEVLGLSTAGIDFKFIDQMLALKTPFDILTIHPYRRVLKDDEFIADLKKASDKVMLPDGRRRPVWLTEMGWATFAPHNTIRQDFAATTLRAQAELIARSYLCAIVSGVEPRTFWYNFRNDGDDPIYFEHQMGIMYQDFRPKPAYIAYATLTHTLKGKVLDGPVATPPGVFAFRFKPAKGSGETVVAAWHPKLDSTLELPAKAPRATLVNAVGERHELNAVAGKFQVPLPKGAPVYLVLAE